MILPSALAQQLERGMRDFLRASFWSSTPGFEGLIERFLDEKRGGSDSLFQGPYVSLELPFERGDDDREWFREAPLPFTPYTHQEEAFERLVGPEPESTLVSTGTGSGKTEAFLLPILEHCARRSGEKGVKAILIYPMNALASDQAERIAEAIHGSGDSNLRGRVTAGLYIGQQEDEPHTRMGPRHVVTDKELLRDSPPDILLTNYKMLDYLLARPRDQSLWQHNAPDTLRYLVVDELHTFDGAQGTDLACLIRRLKARLKTPDDYLCCVGTSATLGGDEEGAESLRRYAEKVFGESFGGAEAVVTETRQTAGDFLDGPIETLRVADRDDLEAMDPERFQDPDTYLERQQQLWFGESVEPNELGDMLLEHGLVRNLVRLLEGEVKSVDEVVEALGREGPLRDMDRRYRRMALSSLLALMSTARGADGEPLVEVQVQLWQREMRRMVANVGERPELRFYDDLTRQQRNRHLPVVHCRECGTMGWATLVEKDQKRSLKSGLKDFYSAFFSRDPRVTFLFPVQSGIDGLHWHVDPETLQRKRQPDEENSSSPLEVIETDNTRRGDYGTRLHRDCPRCGADETLSLIGFQAATLTSTFINQLYASGFNEDKKLLTFSDSVQDAAHRAGFFGSRTWRFNLRIAVQQVVDQLLDDRSSLPLLELPEVVTEQWCEKLGEEDFAATFIAPNMTWLRDYETMTETGSLPEGSELVELIRRRLSWELFGEYTLNARIGRALPRTGASVAYVEPERIESALDTMLEPLQNQIGGMRSVGVEELRPLVLGLLRRLQENGAVYQPEIPESYLESGGDNTYVMSQLRKHLPDVSPSSRLPRFLASRSTARFECLSHTSSESWYDTWLGRCLASTAPLVQEMSQDVWELVLSGLVESGVLEKKRFRATDVWGIRPDALRVTNRVERLRCTETGELLHVAAEQADDWSGVPGLKARGEGVYQRIAEVSEDDTSASSTTVESLERFTQYYANLYQNGDVRRIVAREHTGLLDREEREQLERAFKADQPEPWAPNLLSCTPTLEMGIDVGDLSSAILCSVPPSRSNYLQRIGRVGRRDGNSLLLTLAEGRPHDLYFFSNPPEMIDGEVETPGVFLNASAVLERQLTAFCLDQWAASGIEREDLPRRLGKVLDAVENTREESFPYTFLDFIQTRETKLLKAFLELFGETLTDEARRHLTRFMHGDQEWEGSLRRKITEGLEAEARNRATYEREVRRLGRRIQQLEEEDVLSRDEQDALDEMQREKDALTSLVYQMNNRPTMHFFTDEGLIPNYAFPEEGVTLKSVVWRRKSQEEAQGDDGDYETFSYEYERPASHALREFAPRNRFYAGGRRVDIERVDVEQSEVELWQFCDQCNYAENLSRRGYTETDYAACPNCGSPTFADIKQRRKMLRLEQVYANTEDQESRISDDRDERNPLFYNEQMLVHFSGDAVEESFALQDEHVPFGYEYLEETSFREINFGEYSDQGETFSIAGVESIRDGFEVCADCGHIQPRDSEEASEHAFSCKSRQSKSEEFIDCLFLYRAFESESIRMLLPFVDQPGYEEKLHSFVAALEMGLRDYFSGRVDHLKTTMYSEPGEKTEGRRQFLVLYDTVPGGTGYLRQLMREDEGDNPIFEVFRRARKRLTSCVCNRDPDKDGCYECLFAYRHHYDMASTSRDTAIEVLTDILAEEDALESVETLGNVSLTGLFDSALEAKLIEVLRREDDASLEKTLVDGQPGYRYRAEPSSDPESTMELRKDGGRELTGEEREPSDEHESESSAWEWIPQVEIGETDGLAANMEVDLMGRLARSLGTEVPELAIFTDGLQFHRDRIGRDMYQRMALVRDGNHLTWSLTWDEVEHVFQDQGHFYVDFLDHDHPGFEEAFFNKIYGGVLGGGDLRHERDAPSLTWLMRFLRPPIDLQAWRRLAVGQAVGWLDPASAQADHYSDWHRGLEEVAPPTLVGAMEKDGRDVLVGDAMHSIEGVECRIFAMAKQGWLNTLGSCELSSLQELSGLKVLVWLDDRPDVRQTPAFRRVWNGYLRLFNLMQFLPNAFFVTSYRQDEFDFGRLLEMHATSSERSSIKDARWQEVREEVAFLDPEYGQLVDQLRERECPRPTPAYTLTDDRGRPTAGLAELAWPEQEVGLVECDPDDPELKKGKKAFEDAGWTVECMHRAVESPELVVDSLEKV
jgi:DEAD/DEAH box helicase domain-containing protein